MRKWLKSLFTLSESPDETESQEVAEEKKAKDEALELARLSDPDYCHVYNSEWYAYAEHDDYIKCFCNNCQKSLFNIALSDSVAKARAKEKEEARITALALEQLAIEKEMERLRGLD